MVVIVTYITTQFSELLDMKAWIDLHCQGEVDHHMQACPYGDKVGFSAEFEFELPDEATLFKLTWL